MSNQSHTIKLDRESQKLLAAIAATNHRLTQAIRQHEQSMDQLQGEIIYSRSMLAQLLAEAIARSDLPDV